MPKERVSSCGTLDWKLKRCSFGRCKNDSTQPEIQFVAFPQPCATFVGSLSAVAGSTHNLMACQQCRVCVKWILFCNHSKLQSIMDITYRTYVCSKHFRNESDPTDLRSDYFLPDTNEETPSRASKFSMNTSTHLVPSRRNKAQAARDSVDSESPRSELNQFLNVDVKMEMPDLLNEAREAEDTDVAMYDAFNPGDGVERNVDEPRRSKDGCVLADHDYYSRIVEGDDRQTVGTVSVLKSLAHTILDNNLNVRFDEESLTVSLQSKHFVEKSCILDRGLNVSIFVRGRPVCSQHLIWKKYPKVWSIQLNFGSFVKDLFDNWFVCKPLANDSQRQSATISVLKNLGIVDSYRYDPVSDCLRSVNCVLLTRKGVCFHCNKMLKYLRLHGNPSAKASDNIKATNVNNPAHVDVNDSIEEIAHLVIKTDPLQQEVNECRAVPAQESRSNLNLLCKLKEVATQPGQELSSFIGPGDDENWCSYMTRLFFGELIKVAEARSPESHDWHPAMVDWCLEMSNTSAESYAQLRNILPLPTVDCLQESHERMKAAQRQNLEDEETRTKSLLQIRKDLYYDNGVGPTSTSSVTSATIWPATSEDSYHCHDIEVAGDGNFERLS